jgi:flagellar biosynthesis regulator FlaF
LTGAVHRFGPRKAGDLIGGTKMLDNATPKGTSISEEMAFQLVQGVILLDGARREKSFESEALAVALNQNMETWMVMRSIIKRPDCGLDDEVKDNLDRLARFVAERTFAIGGTGENDWDESLIEGGTIDSLININLQISEGLLEGDRK